MMIRFLLTLATAAWAVTVHAQGTVWFQNLDSQRGIDAPVFESDGVTKLSGAQFIAELLGGPSTATLASLATTSFLQGPAAGYYNGGIHGLPSVAGGALGWVQVRVWSMSSGASFLEAQASGLPNSWWQSSVFSVVTGTTGSNPTFPGALTGLGTSPVYLNSVPEPSTLAVAGLGVIMLLASQRRNRRT
jgi:hypothetical protein